MRNQSDTIIALSTPPGEGAIGVIRLSGDKSITLCDTVFHGKNLSKVKSHTVHYGKILDENDRLIDECLVTVFRAPRSYTTEDIIEISCHGSRYIINEIIQLFLRMGVRQADPGEFTMRSFLNGQMDLTQAEAVADLIASESKGSHDLAIKQMRGGFSKIVKVLRDQLIEFASLIELELDFSEEDVEFADRKKLISLLDKTKSVVQNLLRSFQLGNVIKKGIPTVIAGRPNAGKSTLLNALLDDERAIVSEIPGTTRDTIEENLNINGLLFKLIDTAGLRDAVDKIESIGVSRTIEKIGKSTMLLYVVDVISTSPEEVKNDIEALKLQSSKLIIVLNKMDLNPYTKSEEFHIEGMITKDNIITTSALNKMNIEYLKEKLYNTIIEDPSHLDVTIVCNSRHYEALYNAQIALNDVLSGLSENIPGDLLAVDIRRALHSLGEITGEISTDDLLESIFSRFCIGK